MRILVAGSLGNIGSQVRPALDSSHHVDALDYNSSSSESNIINIDLTDDDQINVFAQSCIKYDLLLFFVGLAHKKGKGKDLSAFKIINYLTLKHLLEAFDKQNKLPSKIVFTSTVSIYGESLRQVKYSEKITPHPHSPYAVTKLWTEQFLENNYKDKSWILRFAPVYSSNFQLNIDRRTKTRNWFYKIGNGSKKLSLCNIENIKTAVEGIIEEVVPAGTYNISDPIAYTYKDLLSNRAASTVLRIPVFAIKLLYLLGWLTNNIFLKENCTKLLTDNIFPSAKIQKYIKLDATINDLDSSGD